MENQQTIKFNTQLQCQNKYQHKLIVLISTIEYVNNKHKKYTQNNLLYYFNGNLRRNGQKETTIKTLQKYLYKLNKEFKITKNYYMHLGVNMGTEIYYKLKHSKRKCHQLINKYFEMKKEKKFQTRINNYFKNVNNKRGSVEKGECIYNIYNKDKEEKESTKSIEKLQIKKYANKCKFKSNTFLPIFNLKADKNTAIEILKIIKRTENFFANSKYDKNRNINLNQKKLENKQQELIRILDETKVNLGNEGYNKKQLEIQINSIYEHYKHKPHFIIENNKYNDLIKIKAKFKKSVEHTKKNTEDKQDIRNNIFSILLEQLQNKINSQTLIPILKEYLNKQENLNYKKVFNNHYYYELLNLIESDTKYLKTFQFRKTVN